MVGIPKKIFRRVAVGAAIWLVTLASAPGIKVEDANGPEIKVTSPSNVVTKEVYYRVRLAPILVSAKADFEPLENLKAQQSSDFTKEYSTHALRRAAGKIAGEYAKETVTAVETETTSMIAETTAPVTEATLVATEVTTTAPQLLEESIPETTETMTTEIETAKNVIYISRITSSTDISGVSGISKKAFCDSMEKCRYDKRGVLFECSETIWETCQEYNLNEYAIVGIIAWESGWCSSGLSSNRHNIMSIKSGGGYKYYDSYQECVIDGVSLIANNYVDKHGKYATGGVLSNIAPVYTGYSGSNWASKVAECANMSMKSIE